MGSFAAFAGGLANTIKSVFLEVPHLLYIWHVNIDVKAYYRKLWKGEINSTKAYITAEERSTFIESRWSDLKDLW
jgi:hypothetical protein